MHVIEIDQFLENKNSLPVLDTRSPGEYVSGHIPGAINLPLFNKDQRAIIGTIYKEEGREKAIKAGLKLIGPKLVDFIEIAESLGSIVGEEVCGPRVLPGCSNFMVLTSMF